MKRLERALQKVDPTDCDIDIATAISDEGTHSCSAIRQFSGPFVTKSSPESLLFSGG
ncbi:hypothetical protein [Pseudomonas sp.]|uniref:hypothetical protein n=1 Tax=Pseudomonas sp. TaxID=306 RepID=UPI003FD8B818